MHFLRKEAQIAMADDRLLRARERIKGAAAKTCGAIGSATVRGYKKRRRRLLAGSKWSGGRLCRQVLKKRVKAWKAPRSVCCMRTKSDRENSSSAWRKKETH